MESQIILNHCLSVLAIVSAIVIIFVGGYLVKLLINLSDLVKSIDDTVVVIKDETKPILSDVGSIVSGVSAMINGLDKNVSGVSKFLSGFAASALLAFSKARCVAFSDSCKRISFVL